MKPSIEVDLEDMASILEGFVKRLDAMPMKDKIDLAARLRPVVKHCETISDAIKGEIKVKLKHEDGTLKGELFKAVLRLIPTRRFSQSHLKLMKPSIHEEFMQDCVDERVSFELR